MVNLLPHSTPVAPFNLPRVWVDAIVIMFEASMNISSLFSLWDFSGCLSTRLSKISFKKKNAATSVFITQHLHIFIIFSGASLIQVPFGFRFNIGWFQFVTIITGCVATSQLMNDNILPWWSHGSVAALYAISVLLGNNGSRFSYKRSVNEDCTLTLGHSIQAQLITANMSNQCAVAPDGSLKDAADIQWYNDADDPAPLPSASYTLASVSALLSAHSLDDFFSSHLPAKNRQLVHTTHLESASHQSAPLMLRMQKHWGTFLKT
jgi:hypothetical protein